MRDGKQQGDFATRTRRRRCECVSFGLSAGALLVIVALLALPFVPDGAATREPGMVRPAVDPRPNAVGGDLPFVSEVRAILSPGLDAAAPDAADMAERLGELGSGALPVVIGLICGWIPAPEFAVGTLDRPIHPAALALREQALFTSLRRFRSKDVVARLRAYGPEASDDQRMVFMRLLGEQATREALDGILELLGLVEPIALGGEQLASVADDAIARCLTADRGALDQLAKSLPVLGVERLGFVVRAVGRLGGADSAAFLARLLGKSPDLDALALQELAQVTQAGCLALPDNLLDQVRHLLDGAEPQTVRTAITILGRVCDRDSAAALVARLEDRDRLIAAAAHWALRNMARADLGPGAEAWLDWLGDQQEWWDSRFGPLCDDLESARSELAFGALSELSLHPLFRHEIAAAVGPLVGDEELSLALTAIAALERLGSTQATAWLVDALGSADARGEDAWRVLRALTGLDLPLERDAWAKALPDGLPL